MPSWDYVCGSCGLQRLEYLKDSGERDWWEAGAPECPACHHRAFERKPSAPNFSVKGFSAKNGYSGG